MSRIDSVWMWALSSEFGGHSTYVGEGTVEEFSELSHT